MISARSKGNKDDYDDYTRFDIGKYIPMVFLPGMDITVTLDEDGRIGLLYTIPSASDSSGSVHLPAVIAVGVVFLEVGC